MRAARLLAAFAAGAVFALGLGIAGALKPRTIQGFLDVGGRWDPTLLVMFATALGTFAVLHHVASRMARPALAPAFTWPRTRRIDAALVGGSAIFGIGWAISGVCPGPALVSAAWSAPIAGFTAALLLTIAIVDRLRPRPREEQGCE